MARRMNDKQLTMYRAVVTTKFLEEQIVGWQIFREGDVVTDIFGPYKREQDARDWTEYQTTRKELTGKKLKASWGEYDEVKYVPLVEQTRKYQRLEPVFHLTPEKGLQLGLEWVTYG